MGKKKQPRNVLTFQNGRWFENGRWLSKKDYIFHSSGQSGSMIISCVTGQLYRLPQRR